MQLSATRSKARPDTEVIGERALAQVIDSILIWGVTFAAAIGLALGFAGAGFLPPEVVIVGILVPIGFVYNVAFEAYRDGQTVGKRVMEIEVRSQAGDLSTRQVALRNLPAIVAPGWLVYLIALVAIVQDRHNRRVFDVVAGTIVAKA